MRGLIGLLLGREADDLPRRRVPPGRRPAAAGLVLEQPGHARLDEAAAPLGHALPAAAQLGSDPEVLPSLGRAEDDAAPLDDAELGDAAAGQGAELVELVGGGGHGRGHTHGTPLGDRSIIDKACL